jgi:diguanylate cyclase (GGDEF)-like protein/PAS domain S-box-containing protein
VTDPSRLDHAALDLVLGELLSRNPDAPIVAIDEDGFFVPVPGSVPLVEHQVIQGPRSSLEFVVPEDMTAIVEAWTTTRKTGAARVSIRLLRDPDRAVTLHYVDATHRHGVYIGMLEMVGSGDLMADLSSIQNLRPKVTMVRKNELAFVLQIDEAMTEILGWTSDEIVGHRTLEFIDPEDHHRAITNWMDMLRVPGSRRRVRLRHKHRDGSWVWFDATNHNLLKEPGHGYVLTEMLDVTDEMTAQDALRSREAFLRRLTESVPMGICQIDADRHVAYRNARLAALLGHPNATSVSQQLESVLPAFDGQLEAALDATLLEGADRDLEVDVQVESGAMRRCSLTLRALADEQHRITGAIICVADVTESVRMREELKHRATYDVLTNCQNRFSILEALERTLQKSERDAVARGTAVIFLDMDHFKELNDRLGHAAGDVFLVEVVNRLKRTVREVDRVGRLGGDEFLIVCSDVRSSAAAVEMADRIAVALSAETIELGAERVLPRASIGVGWSNTPITADELVALADQAMYRSKRLRHGRPELKTVRDNFERVA